VHASHHHLAMICRLAGMCCPRHMRMLLLFACHVYLFADAADLYCWLEAEGSFFKKE
jgi:hypothetical protein